MAATTSQPKSVPPSAFEAELVKMDAGVQASLPAGVSITVNGNAMKQNVIDNTLQGWITTWKAVDQAKQAYKDALAARLAVTVEARTFYKQLKAALKTYFGNQSSVLATFGIAADKPVSTTTKAKLVAAAKRSQTRTVRGTKGKKQAAAITVVGNPPVSIGSDGQLQVGPTPVKTVTIGGSAPSDTTTPSSSPSSTPASTAAPSTTPAPAGSGSGSGTPGSSTPAGA